ncbi:MAG TPA: hypothetical protein VGC89_13750 [Pyrinomonadaceae bacterium]|jgi:hypothetical protein
MNTISELIAHAKADDSSGDETDTLVKLRGDEAAHLVLYLLLEHLGQYDERRGVHVDVYGRGRHYFSRTNLLKAASLMSRSAGYDVSGGFQIPGGENSHLIKLCCTEHGCAHFFYVVEFDEDNPPLCDRHGNQRVKRYMELCK